MLVRTETGHLYMDTDGVQRYVGHKKTINIDKLPDYMQRVVKESEELETKIEKLSAYLDNKKEPESEFSVLEMREEDLMRRQLNAMLDYLSYLILRINMYT